MPRMDRLFVLLFVLAPVLAFVVWQARSQPASPPRPVARRALPREVGWVPEAKSDRWECIVIHHSATDVGGADRFDRSHRAKGWDELGYHFVIGNGSDTPDGRVEVGPRWASQKHGAHCKTPDEYYNQHGIGICLVGNLDEHAPTAAQARGLRRLVRLLCHEFRIPPGRIYTHGGVTRQTRCPGKRFDLQALRDAAGNGG